LTPPGREGLDLTQVNLGRDIHIGKRGVKVYEEDQLNGAAKPELHEKLNVPSIITMFRVEPRGNKSAQQQEDALRKILNS